MKKVIYLLAMLLIIPLAVADHGELGKMDMYLELEGNAVVGQPLTINLIGENVDTIPSGIVTFDSIIQYDNSLEFIGYETEIDWYWHSFQSLPHWAINDDVFDGEFYNWFFYPMGEQLIVESAEKVVIASYQFMPAQSGLASFNIDHCQSWEPPNQNIVWCSQINTFGGYNIENEIRGVDVLIQDISPSFQSIESQKFTEYSI